MIKVGGMVWGVSKPKDLYTSDTLKKS